MQKAGPVHICQSMSLSIDLLLLRRLSNTYALCTRYVLAPMVKKAFEGYDTVLIVLGESDSGKRELLGKCLVLQVGRPTTEIPDEFKYSRDIK